MQIDIECKCILNCIEMIYQQNRTYGLNVNWIKIKYTDLAEIYRNDVNDRVLIRKPNNSQ